MEQRYLGRTGLKVSALCLGCMTFGEKIDEASAYRILDRFVEAGGNFFDTANNYVGPYGASEEIVGSWLKTRGLRDQRVIATKVRFPVGEGANDVGLSRKHIMQAVETSLRRLQTEYIDLYQAHCWDFVTPVEETLRAFDDLVTAGKVRYIGASNFASWHLMKSLAVSDAHSWARYSCLQTQYNLLTRSPEWELLPLCREEGVGVTVWSPLAAGWLTGKYRQDEAPAPDTRIGEVVQTEEEWQRFLQIDITATIPHPPVIQSEEVFQALLRAQETERRWRVIETIRRIAQEHGKTATQVALAWVRTRPGVTAPILGVRSVEQLEENLGCLGWHLSEAAITLLNKVSDPGLPYPHDFFAHYGIPWR
jgi:aryl-alcohol dehydrogenase-like predicted oxidoreductase